MKKFLPLVLLIAGAIVLVAVFIFVQRSKQAKPETNEEESVLVDISFKDRPYVSLIPTSDGHYLKLKIEKIVIPAKTLDYELLYQTKDDVTQGVPGTVNLEAGKSFEVDLLLGSESSGKFRYDEGVETGSVTLRFRNDKGKLVARFATDFHMQSNTDSLESFDKAFSYKLSKKSTGFFVTMNTIGTSDKLESLTSGPIGIFTSETSLPEGTADASWQKLGNSIFYK